MVAKKHEWVEGFPGEITVCDRKGTILALNKMAVNSFRNLGGKKLVGSNLFDCHPEPARTKLKRLMRSRRVNVYTVRKGRFTKLVMQAPWLRGRRYSGFVEIDLRLTAKIPLIVHRP